MLHICFLHSSPSYDPPSMLSTSSSNILLIVMDYSFQWQQHLLPDHRSETDICSYACQQHLPADPCPLLNAYSQGLSQFAMIGSSNIPFNLLDYAVHWQQQLIADLSKKQRIADQAIARHLSNNVTSIFLLTLCSKIAPSIFHCPRTFSALAATTSCSLLWTMLSSGSSNFLLT